MPTIISHASHRVKYDAQLQRVKDYISRIDSPSEKQRLLTLLSDIEDSYLGRFLISNRGLDGQVTQYVVLYPKYKQIHPDEFPDGTKMLGFDRDFLERFPVILATQERFAIFQEQLHKHIRPDSVMASLPCGLMDDFLTLALPQNFDGRLIGIDADPISIQKAFENAEAHNRGDLCEFFIRDGWNLDQPESFDIITSNGLNIYVKDEEGVIDLYRSFYTALKPKGILITSFLTPSPLKDPDSEWDLSQVNMEDAKEQKEALIDLIRVNWAHFYTSKQTINQLKEAGFSEVEIHWDRQKMFPTVVAYKK